MIMFASGWLLLARDTPESGEAALEDAGPSDAMAAPGNSLLSGLLASVRRLWWLVLASIALGFVLVSLIIWMPTYFVEVGQIGIGPAAALSALLPIAGIAGTLTINFQTTYGRTTPRFHSRETSSQW